MHDEEIEQYVIGSAIRNENFMSFIIEAIKPEHFYFPHHKKIWLKMSKSFEDDKDENKLTLGQLISQVAGDGYISILMGAAGGIERDLRGSVQELVDLYHKRRIFESVQVAANSCQNNAITADEIKEILENELGSIENQKEGRTESASQSMIRVAQQSTASHDGSNTIILHKTGFESLDQLMSFKPSDLIILASRPAMGKSALAVNLAVNIAKTDKAVLFFSFEMSNDQTTQRILASETSIPLGKIADGFVSFNERKELEKTAQEFGKIPLIIHDTSGMTLNSLRARIKRALKKQEIGLVVIDYLQLIKTVRRNSRVEEVSEITRTLKEIAMDLSIPILALSQLSRALESREDKRPQLSDLRESGSIEQDANAVIFLYRDDYYNKDQPQNGRSEVIIAKQRQGKTGTANLFFEPEFSRFTNSY